MIGYFRYIVYFVIATTMAVGWGSCARRTVVSDDELALIFHDAFISNAYIDNRNINLDSLRLYEPIFQRYGYTTEDVQYTIGNFSTRKSARLGDVVEQAIKMLERQGVQLDREVAILDTVDNIITRRTTTAILRDSLMVMESWSDSTKFSLLLDQPQKGEYKLSFRYNIDSKDAPRAIYTTRMVTQNVISEDSVAMVEQQSLQMRKGSDAKFDMKFHVKEDADRLVVDFAKINRVEGTPRIELNDIELWHVPTIEAGRASVFHEVVGLNIFNDELLFAQDSL